ncbi:T9SS type A sorting domain-containing protein [Parasediminibacterium sp. JCM 36343]|uniref:T9SS type A sorting domain-containing protein n=1 Tax=Parasediminibacterium sp. JCM 36343 TaxID=3374279 RepID=UPI0039786B3D
MKIYIFIITLLLILESKITSAQLAIRSYTTATSSGNNNLITIFKPSGLIVGDLLFLQCGANECGYSTCSSPGWNLIIENNWPCTNTNGFTHLSCLYKIADSNDVAATDFTFTISVGPQTQQAILLRIAGHDLINPIAASAQDSIAGSNPSFKNSVKPVVANSLYLMSATNGLFGVSNPTIANSNPTWKILSQNSLHNLFYAIRPETTSTGNSSFTAKNSNWLCQMIIITPKVTLPVQIFQYNLLQQGTSFVENSWSTSTELNTNYFNIQRSANSKDFITIGKVIAKNKPSSYTYNDSLTKIEREKPILYRLEIVDKDGTKTYSGIKEIILKNQTRIGQIVIYPNPAKEVTNIYSENAKEIKIINSLGQTIQVIRNPVKIQPINVQHFDKGLFIIRIVGNDNEVKTEKLIVN